MAGTATMSDIAVASPAAVPRRLAMNFLFLSGGEIAAKLLTFAGFSYLARTLGPVNYGVVEFTLAVMVFFTLPVDLGLSWYGTREIAHSPGAAGRLLHEITGLRLAVALCSIAALAIFLLFLQKGAEVKTLLALYGASLLGAPFMLHWFFQGHDQMHWVALASIVRQAVFAVPVFLVCRRGAPLAYIGIIECVSVAAVGVFSAYVVRCRMGAAWPWPDIRIARLLPHLKQASPIGFTELAWAFMWYFCTVLLGFTAADRTLGWFGAAHRVLMALHTFVMLYFLNLLPSISRCAGRPHQELLDLMERSVRFVAWAGLFAAGFLTAAAPEALGLVYGASFRPAAASFVILVWMLPIAVLSGHHRFILIAYKCQQRLLTCTIVSAGAAIALAFVLIPLFRGPGAAWTLVIANLINLVLVYFSVRQLVVEVPVVRELVRPVSV